ncbi:Ribosomal RNA small subunit methyltransferase H [Candidatus Vidania fulgoroideae]|nr:Ribosomal RNA small subunit methyltransferase H [Candidatus Vidania fulgoroideae]
MIFKNQRTFFKKQIKDILEKIKNKKGIFIDFTFGTGKISKIIKKKISKGSFLVSYDFNKLLKKNVSMRNFFFYNLCFSSFKNLVLSKKVIFSIIDMGYSDNELINNYFDGKSINELINFFSIKEIEKKLGFSSFFFLKYIKKKRYQRKPFLLENFITEYKNKDKKKILFYFRNFIYSFKKKIKELLEYLFIVMKKGSCITFICFNSYEAKIVKKFYKKNLIYFSYNKVVKRINKKTIAVLRILERK